MTRLALLCLPALLLGASAHADVWQRAVEGNAVEASRAAYAKAMEEGDDHVGRASVRMISPNELKRQVDLAIAAYRTAAAARPTEGEPYARIATVIDHFFLCTNAKGSDTPPSPLCDDPGQLTTGPTFRKYAPEVIRAWEELEARAPLDPRFTVIPGTGGLLFERAIMRTKLESHAQLEAAARDYELIIRRSDRAPNEEVFGNLAETYMMVGRLDDAIEMYKRAVTAGASSSTSYGLAVALDRDGQSNKAAAMIRELGQNAVNEFEKGVTSGRTFYVPFGEVFYYRALIQEAFGNDMRALEFWRLFIASNAHPQFQARAKEHVDTLTKRIASKPAPRRDLTIDWKDLP